MKIGNKNPKGKWEREWGIKILKGKLETINQE